MNSLYDDQRQQFYQEQTFHGLHLCTYDCHILYLIYSHIYMLLVNIMGSLAIPYQTCVLNEIVQKIHSHTSV